MTTFDELLGEAAAAPFTGWDFSWLQERTTNTALPWSYEAEVAARAETANSMLDMGTGGGEWLSEFRPHPRLTLATESYEPNVKVAADRLRPLGIPLLRCEGAPDNYRQDGAPITTAGILPLRDGSLNLVINRHESFRAKEVYRVLVPGGTFVTQQVDRRSHDDLYRLLGLVPPPGPSSWLPLAVRQLTSAGFVVMMARAGEQVQHFGDVGAVAYYLKGVSWAIPGYGWPDFRPLLRAAHETRSLWPFPVRHRRFLIVATKPGRRGLRIGSSNVASLDNYEEATR